MKIIMDIRVIQKYIIILATNDDFQLWIVKQNMQEVFDIPYNFYGMINKELVWECIATIKYGNIISYTYQSI